MMRGFFCFLFLSFLSLFLFFAHSRLISLSFCFISQAAIPIWKEGLFYIDFSQNGMLALVVTLMISAWMPFSCLLENQSRRCLEFAARQQMEDSLATQCAPLSNYSQASCILGSK